MVERMTLSLAPWAEMPDDERAASLGYANPDLDISLHHYESDFVRIRDQAQQFNVLVVKNGDGPTTLMSTSFDYRIDPLTIMKASTIATQLGGTVAVSEVPGATKGHVMGRELDTPGAWLSPQQLSQAFAGNLDLIGLEQWRAFDSALDFQDGDVVQTSDESLGAYISVARARALARGLFHKRVHISRMDLIEPVNSYGNYTIMRQIAMAQRLRGPEISLRNVYLQENRDLGINVDAFERISDENRRIDQQLKRRQQLAVLAMGAGLRKGFHTALKRVAEDRSESGPRLHEGEVLIARGLNSTVSHRGDILAAQETVKDAGGSARVVELLNREGRAGHHVMDNIPRLAGYTIKREALQDADIAA